jgi:hypothetical protein
METLTINKNELKELLQTTIREELDRRDNFLGYEKISKEEEKELSENSKEEFVSIDSLINKLENV